MSADKLRYGLLGKFVHCVPLNTDDSGQLSTAIDLRVRNEGNYPGEFFFQLIKDLSLQKQQEIFISSYAPIKNDILWLIYEIQTKQPVGLVALDKLEADEAELGRCLVDCKKRRNGFFTEAAKLVIEFAFIKLRLRKIFLEVLTQNTPAVNCYTKLGFKMVGQPYHQWGDNLLPLVFKMSLNNQ